MASIANAFALLEAGDDATDVDVNALAAAAPVPKKEAPAAAPAAQEKGERRARHRRCCSRGTCPAWRGLAALVCSLFARLHATSRAARRGRAATAAGLGGLRKTWRRADPSQPAAPGCSPPRLCWRPRCRPWRGGRPRRWPWRRPWRWPRPPAPEPGRRRGSGLRRRGRPRWWVLRPSRSWFWMLWVNAQCLSSRRAQLLSPGQQTSESARRQQQQAPLPSPQACAFPVCCRSARRAR